MEQRCLVVWACASSLPWRSGREPHRAVEVTNQIGAPLPIGRTVMTVKGHSVVSAMSTICPVRQVSGREIARPLWDRWNRTHNIQKEVDETNGGRKQLTVMPPRPLPGHVRVCAYSPESGPAMQPVFALL